MSKCYFEDSVRAHAHVGPFERCAVCGKTICPECIGQHSSSGGVWCIRCTTVSLDDDRLARYTYRTPIVVASPPTHTTPRPAVQVIVSVLSGLGHLTLLLLRGLLAPLRRTEQQPADWDDINVNFTLATLLHDLTLTQ